MDGFDETRVGFVWWFFLKKFWEKNKVEYGECGFCVLGATNGWGNRVWVREKWEHSLDVRILTYCWWRLVVIIRIGILLLPSRLRFCCHCQDLVIDIWDLLLRLLVLMKTRSYCCYRDLYVTIKILHWDNFCWWRWVFVVDILLCCHWSCYQYIETSNSYGFFFLVCGKERLRLCLNVEDFLNF